MLGLPRPEVINLSESEERSDDMNGLSSETTWEIDQSGGINVPAWLRRSEEQVITLHRVLPVVQSPGLLRSIRL